MTSQRTHCLSPARARMPIDAPVGPATYGRMFPELPALDVDEALLRAVGRTGGLCDCGDAADAPESLGDVAAGWPIFGQFVAHDLTSDRSPLRGRVDPTRVENARSPQMIVRDVVGDGPVGHPFLY